MDQEETMRRIEISDDVWAAVAERGKFGETEDDVLRRVFGLPEANQSARPSQKAHRSSSNRTRQRQSTNPMHAGVHNSHLVVQFQTGAERRWDLPDRADKAALRDLRRQAVAFALENGASNPGQTNAVLKALTDAGYHLTK